MSLSTSVARRYAIALVEMASPGGQIHVDQVARELGTFAKAMHDSTELKAVMLNPAFGAGERRRILEAVMQGLALSDEVRRFIGQLESRARLNQIDAIARSVQRLADVRAGRVRADVNSAAPMSTDEIEHLRRVLERRTGKAVELEVSVDPSLLGGLRAQIGSTVLDGTLRSQLERLREALSQSE